MTTARHGLSTRSIHAGEAPDPATGAHGVPIYQNTTYSFRSYDHVEAWRCGQAPHFVYQREGNPTVRCFELKMADLEGAEEAAAGATGMAVIAATLLGVTAGGGHLVASADLYEVASGLVCNDLPAAGAAVTTVDITDLAAVEAACTEETRAIYCETFSNPGLKVADISALAEIAHRHDALLIVDNTFLSPALMRPLEHGADLVIHSATKYLAGHGQAMGGVVAGPRELVAPIAGRLSRLGGAMNPFTAWLLLTGMKTLPLRMDRHSINAARIADVLVSHPAVKRVAFPGLSGHPGHGVARGLCGDQFGGLLSFTVQGGQEAVRAFINALELCTIAVSLGECGTLVWPYPDGLIRVAVGLEDVEDLERDVARALGRACSAGI
ncbi:MAG: trans-sulfuration enzyme family protein [Thermomicrobiales bacterium]